MFYQSDKREEYQEYVAPLLGNGNMALQVDYEGGMVPERKSEKVKNNPSIQIWRAGRRDAGNLLLPFGYFQQKLVRGECTELEKYCQELNTSKAVIRTQCSYKGNIHIETEVTVHHNYNLIMVNKKLYFPELHSPELSAAKEVEYCFEYVLDQLNGIDMDRCFEYSASVMADNGIQIDYSAAHGQRGRIILFSNKKVFVKVQDNVFSLICNISQECEEITYYILFSDNYDTQNYIQTGEQIKGDVLRKGYSCLQDEHIAAWKDYYNEGFVTTNDMRLNEVYQTAQYHIKCYTTTWSVPVGLCDELWQGRYFAFDEFYILMALLSSNHIDAAYRIPNFRAMGLEKALARGSSPRAIREAHYPWETLENGNEDSSAGYWNDHVFHMACIACGEYYYYKYTGDKDFLREKAYPVIKGCALFYLNHMLYEIEGGKLIVGKCTDLERLGSSVSNAYMTTCGVIKTFHVFCEAAQVLNVDNNLIAECAEKAERLRLALPNDGEKYIPYEGCKETSIGLISGLYPFDVMDPENILQRKGIKSYIDAENDVGNMYAVGKGVCSWYMAWKAIVYIRLGETDCAFEAIKNVVSSTGNFAEMYEINDIGSDVIFRPWFTTAAGMMIQAVNEMFLKYTDGKIYIAPSVPKNIKSFSFKLATYAGIVVEASVKDNCFEKIVLTCSNNEEKDVVYVSVNKRFYVETIVFQSYEAPNSGWIKMEKRK